MDNPIHALPAPVQQFLQQTWQDGSELRAKGLELYGFRYFGLPADTLRYKTFMARHPPKPMFLQDHPTPFHNLILIVGPAGTGQTLVTVTATADEKEKVAEQTREAAAELVEIAFAAPGIAAAIRQMDLNDCKRL